MRSAGAARLAAVAAVAALAAPAGLPGSAGASGREGDASPTPTVHSSDGVVGPTARPLRRSQLMRAPRSREVRFRVGPGLWFDRWDAKDARGPYRVHLLTANLEHRRLRVGYAGVDPVASREPLRRIVRANRAVAGINGDFFDIGDTGAPLGVGVDSRAVLHGPESGWTTSFLLFGRSTAAVGQAPVTAQVRDVPEVPLAGVNTPWVKAHGVAMYTPRWGPAPGRAVTEGAARDNVREVLVRRGTVVANEGRLSSGTPIKGRLLVGRGAGARALEEHLPVGTRVQIDLGVAEDPRVVVGGSVVLVRDGAVVTDDDRELHPRTAVGFDADTGRLLMVVVDGRQEHSRGVTLRELGVLLRDLGADEAVNLDGGGSSTMVGRRPNGRLRVLNSPSDGAQRPVPNGLQVRIRPRR